MKRYDPSEIATPYAVLCTEHGRVYLTRQEYTYQLGRAYNLWLCWCGRACEFDDENYEHFEESE